MLKNKTKATRPALITKAFRHLRRLDKHEILLSLFTIAIMLKNKARDTLAIPIAKIFRQLRWLEARGILLGLNAGKNCTIAPDCFIDVPSGLRMGHGVYINSGAVILAHAGVEIGDNTLIAPGVSLITAGHDMSKTEKAFSEAIVAKPISIGKNCWICTGSIILPGVNIGDGAVVAAGSVVNHDVESFSIVAGIPAKKIGMRNSIPVRN